MTNIPHARGESSPLPLIPVVSDSGILCFFPEALCRTLAPRGPITLTFSLPQLPQCNPPAVGEGGKPLTDPAPIKHWAAVFHVHPQTMASYLRTGQVRGRPVGRLWQIEVRDLPTKDDDSKRR